MMFYKVVLTFLVIAALSVNVLAAPTSLRARAEGNDKQQLQMLDYNQRMERVLLQQNTLTAQREVKLLLQLKQDRKLLRNGREEHLPPPGQRNYPPQPPRVPRLPGM